MRRVTIAAVLGPGLLLGALVAAVGPRPGPAPGEVPRRAREAGLQVGAALGTAAPGPLRAGAASVELELPAGTLLGGYASLRARRSAGPGHLVVSALVLSTPQAQVALTGLDAVTVAPALHTRVRAGLDKTVAWVSSASHTHSGPGGCGHGLLERLFLGPPDPVLLDGLARAHLQAIARARRDQVPAQLLDGAVQTPALVVNRTEAAAPIDTTVDVLALVAPERMLGRVVATGAHATLVSARDRLDPDYPGRLRQALAAHDPSPLLFAAAATGSASAPRLDPADPAAAMGEALAAAVDATSLTAQPADLALGWRRAWLELPPPRLPLPGGLALRTWLSGRLVPGRVPLDVVRAGPVLLVALPGELSAELSPALRARAAARGWHLVLTSHNGVYTGYFMPSARYQAPGPEAALELHGPGSGEIVAAFVVGVIDGMGNAPLAAAPGSGP